MKRLAMMVASGALGLMLMPGVASANVCSYNWTPGGGDAVAHWLTAVHVATPQTVTLQYFGGWHEIVIYNLAQSVILYQGPPIASYNAADGIVILAYKVDPGAALRITTDWSMPPPGCT